MPVKRDRRSKGQALVMVTVGLFAMVGLVGLAVDLSWGYFLEKTMQAAADAAALSAVQAAEEKAGSSGGITCGNVSCYSTQTSCSTIPSTSSAYIACQYAAANGFSPATAGQEVTIVADAPPWTLPPTVNEVCAGGSLAVNHPPTSGCVDTTYWVTVRISQEVPQLFSAILGNYKGRVSARATAAVVQAEVQGSLILLNRASDMDGATLPNTAPPAGTNLEQTGSGQVIVPGGIHLSSGSSVSGHESGIIQGANARVTSPYTRMRTGGTIGGSHPANWVAPPTPTGDGPSFFDPMREKGGQPPINTSVTLPLIEVPNGDLAAAYHDVPGTGRVLACPGWVCIPGIYMAVDLDCGSCASTHPSGQTLTIPNNTTVRFAGGTTFSDWMFIGGLDVGQGSTVNLDPGRYVFAGTLDPSRDNLLDIPNGVTINGGTGTDAGRLMIFTDFRNTLQRDTEGAMTGSQAIQAYAAESTVPGTIGGMNSIYNRVETFFTRLSDHPMGGTSWDRTPFRAGGLGHGPIAIQAGNNASSRVEFAGLAKGDSNENLVPDELKPFAPVAMWQDQHNSFIRYRQAGIIDVGCASPNNTIDRPCSQTPDDAATPGLLIWATPYTNYRGAIYQPRGAWTTIQASGNYTGALQIITGGMKVQGSPNLTLTGLSTPITTYSTALIE